MSDPLEADRFGELEKEVAGIKAALREMLDVAEAHPDDFEVGEYETIFSAAIARARALL